VYLQLGFLYVSMYRRWTEPRCHLGFFHRSTILQNIQENDLQNLAIQIVAGLHNGGQFVF